MPHHVLHFTPKFNLPRVRLGGLLRRREGKTEADVRALMRAMEHEILCEIGIPIGLELKEP